MKYILASASPRRKKLLTQAGIEFEVIPSDVDEKFTAVKPSEIVMELSMQKAEDVFCRHGDGDCLVIAADTIVSYEGEVLGKPRDEKEAFDMLSLLSDRTHQVYTGVTLRYHDKGIPRNLSFFECTDVTFFEISGEELREYIRTGDCMDKAGGYGIQGPFAVHVRRINGDYNNVVGLPIARLYQELKKIRGI